MSKPVRIIFLLVFLLSSCKTVQLEPEATNKKDENVYVEKQPDNLVSEIKETVTPPLPDIHATFVLNSLSGNGFGVVAKVTGEMAIGTNTVLIYPKSIELRSFSSCTPACPSIHSIAFSLTREGENHFSTISQSELIFIHKKLHNVRILSVNIPAEHPPFLLYFTDRQQLTGLRLTLEINGELNIKGKTTAASWYTHAKPFSNALGHEPVKLEPAPDAAQRLIQAQQAVFDGRVEDLQQLFQAGVDANARDAGGQTMLMRAANRGDLSSVKLLLVHGAKVNATTAIDKEGNGALTALHAALRQDSVNVVSALIKAGANPQAAANRVWTPMHYGAYLGATQSIRYLHKRKVSIDVPFKGSRGSTPLMIAAQFEQIPTIRVLLELGADSERKDLFGEDACGYARFFKKPASIKALGCK
jgi:cellobiose-specific phosphotransferase system component IIA